MLRRLHPDQPDAFAFTDANRAWAETQIAKFPDGRQASAVIPLLWRAQEQEGWLTRPAIEHVADMLGMARIRALEVATFYFMFHLQPVGSVAHFQICGTTPCMLRGAEDLIATCKERIHPRPHHPSEDGRFSWEEVECLGACANAPMAQIGKDYFEDLTPEGLGDLIDRMAAGEVPAPGSQAGRHASEPSGGLTSLEVPEGERQRANASVRLAALFGDTLKRIDGTEQPREPVHEAQEEVDAERMLIQPGNMPSEGQTPGPRPSEDRPVSEASVFKQAAEVSGSPARPRTGEVAEAAGDGDPAVGRQVGVGEEPTVGETKPEDAGPVAEGGTGRDVPEGQETRGGVIAGNVATSQDDAGPVRGAEDAPGTGPSRAEDGEPDRREPGGRDMPVPSEEDPQDGPGGLGRR